MAKKKKFNYFDSFQQQIKYAIKEVDILEDAINNFVDAKSLYKPMQKAHDLEHTADVLNHEIRKNIAIDFITPIDREDLMNIACCLDTIIDQIENIVQHFYVFDVHEIHPACHEFVKILRKACVALSNALNYFSNFKKNKAKLKQAIIEINAAEDEADIYYIEIMRELFTTFNDKHMHIIIWHGIFELFEDCCDACERSADAIDAAVLKNS